MLHDRISLVLLAILVISGSVIIATRHGQSQTSLAPRGPRVKVLRRKDQLGLKPTKEEIASLQGNTQERKLKVKTFKDMPLEVREVRDLQSDTWYKDLEIEVKNVSTKPIYFILANLIFPDYGNGNAGIPLHFGYHENIDIRRIADPQDLHLNPGDTFVFTISKGAAEGLKERSPEGLAFRKLELHIGGVISFGDGTGFAAERLRDFRLKRSPSDTKKNNHSSRPKRSAPVGSPTGTPQEERELEDKTPRRLPIKIKITKEKERAFKDLKNDKWLRDLELEVTNTSDKPIYFLELWVVLPEVISENGMEVGFPLRYGRVDFIHFNTLALPGDIPISPGERYVYRIADNYQRGWEAHKARENRPDPKRIQIKFVQLSFGDGTGFSGTDGKPYPESYGCASTVAFLSSLPQPTKAPRAAVATDLIMT